jgi:uncharacterized membrane protein
MSDELFFVWSAIWQEQATAIALFVAGYGFWKGFLVLLIGSSIGIFFTFYVPEFIEYSSKPIAFCLKHTCGRRKEKLWYERWALQLHSAIDRARNRLTHRLVHNGYPQWAVFIAVAIPIPSLYLAPIAAARILNLRRGFTIVYLASVLRSFIIALIVHQVCMVLK